MPHCRSRRNNLSARCAMRDMQTTSFNLRNEWMRASRKSFIYDMPFGWCATPPTRHLAIAAPSPHQAASAFSQTSISAAPRFFHQIAETIAHRWVGRQRRSRRSYFYSMFYLARHQLRILRQPEVKLTGQRAPAHRVHQASSGPVPGHVERQIAAQSNSARAKRGWPRSIRPGLGTGWLSTRRPSYRQEL